MPACKERRNNNKKKSYVGVSGRAARMSLRQRPSRGRLLAGVSGVALMLSVGSPALARPVSAYYSNSGPSQAALQAAQQAAQNASQAALRSQNALQRATQALQAMRAAQSAAGALARSTPNAVPNGLVLGGLNPVSNPNSTTDGLTTWVGADMPVQSTAANGVADVKVRQTQANAILSWQTFNVGSNTTLTFDQQGNTNWTALNRVVGSTAPSQILGNIKADGTVLVINQNGIIFGGGAQINVGSLIATTLEIGRAVQGSSPVQVLPLAQRNQEFLDYGVLGAADNFGGQVLSPAPYQTTASTFSATYRTSGSILVQNGAEISSAPSGYILFASPVIENAGHLSAVEGQVILAALDGLTVQRATGASDSANPGIRGLLVTQSGISSSSIKSVVNDVTGLIESTRGSIILTGANAAVNKGGLFATTSISRNGAIAVLGPNIELSPGSTIAITPDDDGGTIPQDPASLTAFKPSQITIGNVGALVLNSGLDTSALIDIGAGSLTYAPSGTIAIGVQPGANALTGTSATSRIFVDDGAVIDASGLKNVLIPASRNELKISPLTANDLADDPLNASTLKDLTVYVDPRLSGVRADGTAWIGSPLIDAASYYQQVGVSVAELMTKGGNVTLGVAAFNGAGTATAAPNVIVKSGATIDISGGWVTYQAGTVRTTRLVDAYGHIVDIGNADPNTVYAGVYTGFTRGNAHWGVSQTWSSALRAGSHYESEYTEGRDAGSLTVKGSAAVVDGAVYADAFPGLRQLATSQVGTGTSPVYGDQRRLQTASSQLPVGGFLFVQAQASGTIGGANIAVRAESDYQALPSTLGYGLTLQVAADGTVTVPTRDQGSFLTASQLGTIALSDSFLSNSGFSAVSLATSGTVTVASNATVALTPGGIFNVLAGHRITVDGTVSAPGGQISLTTFGGQGSVFAPRQNVGDYDIVIDGKLSTRGRWVNDYGLPNDSIGGSAWLNGGSIMLYAAPRVTSTSAVISSGATPATTTDLSGSIYVNAGSVLDVSGGGRVDQKGKLNLTAHGGNLGLYAETSYYDIAGWGVGGALAGAASGFRVTGLTYNSDSGPQPYVPVNPAQINAKVAIDINAIRAQGFGGGGTFTLATPEFAFSDDASSNASANATRLPLSFFSSAGFANYNITSYKTALFANPFSNVLGGTDAVLATQTLTIGAGQNLNLTQAMLPSVLGVDQFTALRNLATGGDIFSVVSAAVPDNAWDRKAASLTLGGLLELHAAQGGSITGDAGAALTVSKLFNEGTIRLPGGSITQREVLPALYTSANVKGIRSLADIFTVNANGTITEGTLSKIAGLTNAQLAGQNQPGGPTYPIYFVGLLDSNQGIVLAPGSLTDLSGTSIRNPYATAPGGGNILTTGRMVNGGSIATLPSATAGLLYNTQFNSAVNNVYSGLASGGGSSNGMTQTRLDAVQIGRDFVLKPGSMLNLSGASDTYDQPVVTPGSLGQKKQPYTSTPVWSNGGTLAAGGNLFAAGATILAQGGAAQALGGTLAALDPVFIQHDPATPMANVISVDMIAKAGFDTLAAFGSVSSIGNVTIGLDRGFFLETRPLVNNGSTLSGTVGAGDNYVPTIRSGGGMLEIDAPYVRFDSNFDTTSTSALGTAGSGSVVFKADNIDFVGAMVIDRSVANATFQASGDIRVIGVVPWQQVYYPNGGNTTTTLKGQIAANGNVNFIAGQLYPATGSTFTITSSAANGTVTFGGSGATPAAPYSAGGNLTVLAANILQGGVIRVPLGTLTLGGAALAGFAPATQNVTLVNGSVTSVSANGLIIPYGTTTDQKEWYFAPTGTNALTAPPAKLLSLNGTNVAIAAGATIDLTGGGDVYAYEFVPGTGGSRDVLNRSNPDPFTGNNGLQYPDGRQVYAIARGVLDKAVAAYDPIYSSDYTNLGSISGVGTRIWLDAAPGLAAGWYTLLPAQYALLPGGMRVVEQTGAANVAAGSGAVLQDGTIVTTGRYGDALSGSSQSQLRLFQVQSQTVIGRESNIVLTTGNSYFAALAAHNGNTAPRLPVDAGQLVLNASSSLALDNNAIFLTRSPAGGLGAQVDIGGTNIDVLASVAGAPADGAVHLTASSLSNLHADSLLIGGTRIDNADGTTTLNVTATNVLVQNDATTPLSAGEVVIAANNTLMVADGSVISATGTLSDLRSGAYQVGTVNTPGSGAGALIRVANGPQRLVARTNGASTATLNAGAATFSGNSVMFDSSGANILSAALVIQNAKFVALGAPRIGMGVDPATYTGLALTDALQGLLSQSGAVVTLRSQSSIDFADGTYNFGSIGFDAGALAGLDGGAVTLNADTVSLGNAGAAGPVCATCNTNNGTLTISAKRILFTGGSIATKTATFAANTSVTLGADATITLPVGTVVGGLSLFAPAQMVVPAGTVLTVAAGTGFMLPGSTSGTLAAGTTVGLPSFGVTLPANSSYYFPNGYRYGPVVASNPLANTSAAATYALRNATPITLPGGQQAALGSDTVVAVTPLFGGGVTLTAQNGIYAEGAGGVFDSGAAALALHTPYIGDRAIPLASGVNAVIPGLTFASSSTVTIDNVGVGVADTVDGIPGASIAVNGQSVSVSGTTIHATAGSVAITSATGITFANGAVIEAPGYAKVFGDAADPTSQNAPGGQVSLIAQSGDIALGNATLSVGGGTGDAGTLALSTPNGAVTGLTTTATLNGTPGTGGAGGTFSLDTKGSVDLAALNAAVGAEGFTGAFNVHTRSGDLTLAAGQSLRSGAVNLTADSGLLTIAGTIDVSGINGGNVALYGINGVTLTGTARINATARGYAAADPTDTRQAIGGNVTIGTDLSSATTNADGSVTGTSGRIQIDVGAAIDVSALHPGDRLVPLVTQGGTYYNYVRGDQGGTVTLRAPAMGAAGASTVNVAVANASSIAGAREIDLVGVKRWDLATVATSGLYTGVTLNSGTVTLDVTAGLDTANADGTMTTVTGINFLGDKGTAGAPTLVDFIQTFDVSASYGNLGGLSSQANFHARPGMDLAYTGNITLASNWNLGAGTVNVTQALADGVMVNDPALLKPVIPVGQEAAIFANYTKLTYRTNGGSITGEPGVLSLRAGGTLDIKGSISDGFFQFRDQTDPAYLANIGLSYGGSTLTFNSGCQGGCTGVPLWSTTAFGASGTTNPTKFVALSFNPTTPYVVNGVSPSPIVTTAPYSAIANSPAALGSFPQGTAGTAGTSSVANGGDPLGSAVMFPLLPGSNRVVNSWSYNLVAGADLSGAAGALALPSVDPTRVVPGTAANLVVEGTSTYSYYGQNGTALTRVPGILIDTNPSFSTTGSPAVTDPTATAANWLAQFSTEFNGVDENSLALLYWGSGTSTPLGALLYGATLTATAPAPTSWLGQFIANNHLLQGSGVTVAGDFRPYPVQTPTVSKQGIFMTVANLKLFYQQFILPNLTTIENAYISKFSAGTGATPSPTVTAYVHTLVRTGTGDIAARAAADINLTNGAPTAQFLYNGGTQQGTALNGGTTIYTAGHPADTTPVTLTAPDTGLPVTITFPAAPASNLSNAKAYAYGTKQASGPTTGYPGMLIVDPVYAEGGGDITIDAGRDVLSRRDAYMTAAYGYKGGTSSWMGNVDEPWRASGAVATSAAIDPQLFSEGLGALGGGDITVHAGRNVSDLSVIATSSLMTGTTAGGTKALATFGRGNVNIAAGNDILGGRVDVASGVGAIVAAGDIVAAGKASAAGAGQIDNLLRLRLSDAMVDIRSGGNLTVQGVAALGVRQSASGFVPPGDDIALGLYSLHAGLGLTADGSVTVANENDGLLTAISNPNTAYQQNAVYPGTFLATALTGDLTIGSLTSPTSSFPSAAVVLMVPSPVGQLQLFAGGDIAPLSLAMLDADPAMLPNWFGIGTLHWTFPTVLPSTSDLQRGLQHNKNATHANDGTPVRIAAGYDIGTTNSGLILSVPKQARVYAGRDIINTMFFGQNLAASDITRVVAGRDITATTVLTPPVSLVNGNITIGTPPEPAVQGNTFMIGGPGSFMLEAGRDIGPFLNSATVTYVTGDNSLIGASKTTSSFGGGILSVGNEWNPWLPAKGADVSVMFGVANGINYDGFRDRYLDPANLAGLPSYLVTSYGGSAASSYALQLIAWMKQNSIAAKALTDAYGTTDVSYAQAYAVFKNLLELSQRSFLNTIYFNELKQTDVAGPNFKVYSRGYEAVNTLFPASYGYTANALDGGSNGANVRVPTGDLDLRLAAIETTRGGDIDIFGPGGRVIAGSTVRTAAQAARRTYDGGRLFQGNSGISAFLPKAAKITAIPSGYEGVLTLRGGNINTFTDGDFLLNQSRLFTEQGGEIVMWSSNADLNAGQGPKTSANFPPVVVKIDPNMLVTTDQAGATTGAGIAALQATPDSPPSDVYLIAPRGTVDAGAAGLRVSGNLSIAAVQVLNAANIQVQGTTIGIPTLPAPNIGGLTQASNAAGAASQQVTPPQGAGQAQPSIIIVEVLGFGGGDGTQDRNEPERGGATDKRSYNAADPIKVVGYGPLSRSDMQSLTDEEKRKLSR
ncbi:filamentous hemagglutinin family protein [Microbacteriaceae bacterium K1510]|nr:filamentous hemagglutinin family protein [Microbacteriaceae bacterium K1510]